jgi:SOS response regulatory protein OraA/RecX
MKITSIKFKKNSYELTIEPVGEKYKITEELLLELKIINNREISLQEYETIREAGIKFELLNKVLNKINFRIRSTQEIKNILREYQADKQTIEYIIDYLTRNHYLNDDLFKQLFISDTINLTDKGPKFITTQLDLNKIEYSSKDLIKINEVQNERVQKIIAKKMKTANGSAYMVKQKLAAHSVQRGYSYTIVKAELENINYSEFESLASEIKKLKSKKYDNSKIIQKLQAKGYQYGNIKLAMEDEDENS